MLLCPVSFPHRYVYEIYSILGCSNGSLVLLAVWYSTLREYTCDLCHLRGGELFLFNHPQPSLISVGRPNMARVRPSPGTSFLPTHPLGPGFPEAFVVSDPDPDCTQLTILLTSLNFSLAILNLCTLALWIG